MIRDVLEALTKTCNEKSFVLFWEFVKKKVENLDVDVPQVTLHNNITKRMKNYFGNGTGEAHHHISVKWLYQQLYLKCLIMQCNQLNDDLIKKILRNILIYNRFFWKQLDGKKEITKNRYMRTNIIDQL